MSIERRRTEIGKGVFLTELIDKKLKTNNFIIHFVTELSEETAAANAAVPILLTDSSAEYPDLTKISRKLASLYGAAIRGSISKFGDCHVVTMSANCIADRYALEGEKISAETIKVLTGCVFAPHTNENGDEFYGDDFHLKKQELLDDIDSDINEKRAYALKQAGKIVFENEAAGISAKGERAAAEKLTPKIVYDAYKKLLSSAAVEIYYVGAGIDEDSRKLLCEPFTKLQRNDIFTISTVPSTAKSEPAEKTERLDVMQSKMVIAYKTDSADGPAMKMFNSIFGATPFSLLFDNVREKLSLCYYCSSSYNNKKKVLYIDSGVENANIEAARNEIANQLDAMKKGEFSDELIDQTKLYLLNALKAVNDSPRGVAEWYFRQCDKAEDKIITPEMESERLKAVTKEQITKCAASLKLDTVYVLTGKEDK